MVEIFTKLNISFPIIIFVLAVIALQTYLIQMIWNKVIIKKFPDSNIQNLTFWEALALSVFVSLLGLSSGNVMCH